MSDVDLDRWLKRFPRVELTLEEDVYEPQQETRPRKRIIDSIIRFYDAQDRLTWVLAIENKIAMSSVTDSMQLTEEYEFLRSSIDNGIPIVFVFLTPDPINNASQAAFNLLPMKDQDIKVNYIWKHSSENPCSITRVARSLLEDERTGIISPASSHADLFLRSLIKFVANDFQLETPLENYIASDNGMTLSSLDEFWERWKLEKPGTYDLATQLFELIKKTLKSFSEDSKLNKVYELDYRPTITRLAFFFHPLDTDVDLLQKKLPNRPVAIFFSNATSNQRVQLQFERRNGVSLDAFRRDLDEQTKYAFDQVQPDESSSNYTTIYLQRTIDLNTVNLLLVAAIKEAAQAAIGS